MRWKMACCSCGRAEGRAVVRDRLVGRVSPLGREGRSAECASPRYVKRRARDGDCILVVCSCLFEVWLILGRENQAM